MNPFVKWLTDMMNEELDQAVVKTDSKIQDIHYQRANVYEEVLEKVEQLTKEAMETKRLTDPWINRLLNELKD